MAGNIIYRCYNDSNIILSPISASADVTNHVIVAGCEIISITFPQSSSAHPALYLQVNNSATNMPGFGHVNPVRLSVYAPGDDERQHAIYDPEFESRWVNAFAITANTVFFTTPMNARYIRLSATASSGSASVSFGSAEFKAYLWTDAVAGGEIG